MAKCLICGWPIEEHSESQVRTCQHRHEELKKRRREETLRRTRKLVTGDTQGTRQERRSDRTCRTPITTCCEG